MEVPFELRSPTHLQIEVTEECNNSCFYCYNHWRTWGTSKNSMTLNHAEQISKVIINEIQPFISTLTGGEPFKNYETTKYLAKELGDAGISVGINTNLVAADKKKLDDILTANSDVSLLVSLPSIKREVYYKITGGDTLPIFFENLNHASQIGIPIYINMVTHQLN